MSNYKTKDQYRDRCELGRRIEPYSIKAGLGKQKALAEASGAHYTSINRMYQGGEVGSLYLVLPALIRRYAFNSEEEVWRLLKPFESKFKSLRNPDGRMRELREAVTEAFASRPEPQKKAMNKELSQKQLEQLRTIADIIDDLRDDGLLD